MSTEPPTTPIYHPPENGFRTFLILWITQSISVIGSALTYFSTTIWLTEVRYPHPEQKAQLAFAVSATGVIWGITHILTTPFAGAWADRHDRKTTMIVCDFLNGILSVALMVMILTSALELWSLLLILAVSTIIGDFHGSSFDTSYAMLVPEKQLPRANGLMQTSWSLSNILSPAMAAMLISLPALAQQGAITGAMGSVFAGISSGTALALGAEALPFFAASSVPVVLCIPSPRRKAGDEVNQKTVWADIKEGALYIWDRRPMLWLLLTVTAANLFFSFMSTLRPLVVKFDLANDWAANGFTFETALALVSSAIGIGGVIGGLVISAWGGLKERRIYGVVIFLLLAGLCQIVFGLSPWLSVAAGASAVWSGIIPFMNSHTQSIWQTQTPHELQGRVFAVRRVVGQFTYPIGAAIAGAAAGVFSAGSVVTITGILLVIFCILQFFNPRLVRVEDKAYLDDLAARARRVPAVEPEG